MKGRREFPRFGLCAVMAIATLLIAGCAPTGEISRASDVMRFVPVEITAGEAVDGWRNWSVRLALLNDTKETLEFDGLQSASVFTEEGYQYRATFDDIGYYTEFPIPPGVHVLSHGLSDHEFTALSFSAAASSTPRELVLQTDRVSDKISRRVDLSQVIDVEYPITGQPDNIPALVDATLEVPGQAVIKFEDVLVRKEKYDYVEYWALVIGASFVNYNRGYDSGTGIECNIFDHLGNEFYGYGTAKAGPSQTTNFTVRIPFSESDSLAAKSLGGGILHCWQETVVPGKPPRDILEMLAVLPAEFPIAEEAP